MVGRDSKFIRKLPVKRPSYFLLLPGISTRLVFLVDILYVITLPEWRNW